VNWVDYLLIAIAVCSVISGFSAGAARGGVGFIAALVGIFAGFWCYGLAASHIVDYVNSRPVANLIGFFLIFAGVLLLGALIGRLLASLFKWIGLSWFDRLLGAAFGFVRGVLVAAALVTVLLAFSPSPPPASIVESKMLPYVVDASNVLAAATPREIKDAFRETKDKVKKIWDGVRHKPALRREEA